jgi:hypothetical protein
MLIQISFLISLLYIILSLPKSFVVSHSIFKSLGVPITFDNNPGVPTTFGLILHAIVFLIIVYIILAMKLPQKQKKRVINIDKPDDIEKIV